METAKLFTSCAPEEKLVELSTIVGCGGSLSGRLRLGDRDEASSHDEGETHCGMMVVTQSKWCHNNDETASVRRVRCMRQV